MTGIWHASLRMGGRRNPARTLSEKHRRWSCRRVSPPSRRVTPFSPEAATPAMSPFMHRGKWLLGLPFGMFCRHRFHLIEGEHDLERHRLLRPESPIVVEGGDAFRDRHEIRTALRVTRATKSTMAFLLRRRSRRAEDRQRQALWTRAAAPPLAAGLPPHAALNGRNANASRPSDNINGRTSALRHSVKGVVCSWLRPSSIFDIDHSVWMRDPNAHDTCG